MLPLEAVFIASVIYLFLVIMEKVPTPQVIYSTYFCKSAPDTFFDPQRITEIGVAEGVPMRING